MARTASTHTIRAIDAAGMSHRGRGWVVGARQYDGWCWQRCVHVFMCSCVGGNDDENSRAKPATEGCESTPESESHIHTHIIIILLHEGECEQTKQETQTNTDRHRQNGGERTTGGNADHDNDDPGPHPSTATA